MELSYIPYPAIAQLVSFHLFFFYVDRVSGYPIVPLPVPSYPRIFPITVQFPPTSFSVQPSLHHLLFVVPPLRPSSLHHLLFVVPPLRSSSPSESIVSSSCPPSESLILSVICFVMAFIIPFAVSCSPQHQYQQHPTAHSALHHPLRDLLRRGLHYPLRCLLQSTTPVFRSTHSLMAPNSGQVGSPNLSSPTILSNTIRRLFLLSPPPIFTYQHPSFQLCSSLAALAVTARHLLSAPI
jgi:hypothetical protein